MISGRQPFGQGICDVVPNNRQIKGRSAYTSQPLGPRCTHLRSSNAVSCSASVFTGRRDISSEEVVTGPQQSWQPGTHSNVVMRSRSCKTISWLLFIYTHLIVQLVTIIALYRIHLKLTTSLNSQSAITPTVVLIYL